jgi:hypothetical protein
MKRLSGLIFLASLLILTSCNLPVTQVEPTTDPAFLATMVEKTLSALATNTPMLPVITSTPVPPVDTSVPLPTPTLSVSKASGKVCYPPNQNTEMRAFFQDTTNSEAVEMVIPANQSKYEIVLDPGTYIAYVWLSDFSRGGMYSDGKSPLPFNVISGQTTSGIDLCDWSTGPFDVPYPPGYDPQQTTGTISGSITYPYGSIPQLTVVAFNQVNHYWYWIGTASGQSYFNFENLPPGKYQVVAYDGSHSGGSDVVTVTAGQNTTANVTDWAGSFPSNPVK